MAEFGDRDVQTIFASLNAMVRTASLYQPAHPQTRRTKDTVYQGLTSYLAAHGRLTYRFVGDLLVANDRILPRESLVYRRLIDTCQREKGIGSFIFLAGLEAREIDVVVLVA